LGVVAPCSPIWFNSLISNSSPRDRVAENKNDIYFLFLQIKLQKINRVNRDTFLSSAIARKLSFGLQQSNFFCKTYERVWVLIIGKNNSYSRLA